MDISSAGTEPLYRIAKFHPSVNRLIKTISASLLLTERELSNESSASDELSELIRQVGEPWGEKNHFSPQKELQNATPFLAEMGIVRVDSAFEDFIISTEGEFSRWLALQGIATPKRRSISYEETLDDETLEHLRVVKLCVSHGWNYGETEGLLLVFQYFHRIRNCIAHRSGRCTEAVAMQSCDGEFLKVWNKIARGRRNAPIELPQLRGSMIGVKPRHVILFSHVCLKIAISVSAWMVKDVSTEGLLYFAAYHALLRDDPLPWGENPKRPESAINWILGERLRVKNLSGGETINGLRALDIWDRCRARFKELSSTKAGQFQ